ncbi:MAG TPA: DUF72 domain-containing protein [Candidatus Eisenbacteria bacterium]|jgi:uncharacterized protein YecE (DUF72 family)|nr:DUF72 domain-containing protein [Candidatus Eisenbacteria bacterium]
MSRSRRGATGVLHVGTSGWAYRGWTRFYPRDLKPAGYLAWYSRQFATVEVNTSFYHLPLASTYHKWASETKAEFLFALKLSRYMTHIKKLKGVKMATRRFLSRALGLGTKLGPLLIQLPPKLHADPKRLARFLKSLESVAEGLGAQRLRAAFEFRHESWFVSEEVLATMRAHRAALVFPQSSRYPYPANEPRTAPWLYLRFHGPRELFASKYGRKGLLPWATKIAAWLDEGSNVYAYFNNDAGGHAPEDARLLLDLVREAREK